MPDKANIILERAIRDNIDPDGKVHVDSSVLDFRERLERAGYEIRKTRRPRQPKSVTEPK